MAAYAEYHYPITHQKIKDTLSICKAIQTAQMTPKKFLHVFLHAKSLKTYPVKMQQNCSKVATLRKVWGKRKGWPSTLAILRGIRGLACKSRDGLDLWSSFILDEASDLLKIDTSRRNLAKLGYVNTKKISHHFFGPVASAERAKNVASTMPFLYNLLLRRLEANCVDDQITNSSSCSQRSISSASISSLSPTSEKDEHEDDIQSDDGDSDWVDQSFALDDTAHDAHDNPPSSSSNSSDDNLQHSLERKDYSDSSDDRSPSDSDGSEAEPVKEAEKILYNDGARRWSRWSHERVTSVRTNFMICCMWRWLTHMSLPGGENLMLDVRQHV
ncbi:uncharacterized protein MELLADRAFT_86163 [Melampsora larici-populina 98AG31]|uniref:Uncharacterized protein n=1 Tax=Melampsora larici-populina (strain 98AG31 / pathotype 3-4-7) TaxID=747676 RepID=F4RKR5_MELLP|nr:uncharacterized protein MELLADRAFT_86163 [Melampsora larici-populina 98AG31]EGG06994.1 hypothetical protein MELLADRAFT_86163 [Melampsora larici-populina 98AG31]